LPGRRILGEVRSTAKQKIMDIATPEGEGARLLKSKIGEGQAYAPFRMKSSPSKKIHSFFIMRIGGALHFLSGVRTGS